MADDLAPKGTDSPESDDLPIEIANKPNLEQYVVDELPVTVTPMSGPSKPSQALAFSSIILGGACGGLIGFAFTDLQCSGSCTSASGLSALIGAVVGAGGVGVVSILALRAMNEWKSKSKGGVDHDFVSGNHQSHKDD
jgi:hypothetical protein